jgi:hypothetical protein
MRDVTGGAREKWVGWASAVCAVHCLASPLLVLTLPMWAAVEAVEHVVLAALPVGTVWLLWHGVRRHGRWWPALPVTAAVVFWGAALWSPAEGVVHAGLVGGGGVLAFTGLQWSERLSRACGCGACAAAAAVGVEGSGVSGAA